MVFEIFEDPAENSARNFFVDLILLFLVNSGLDGYHYVNDSPDLELFDTMHDSAFQALLRALILFS